jgi:regulator of replication initiation timing
MTAAGFKDFERGERGSTADHLSDLEYKTKMESGRLAAVSAEVQNHVQAIGELDEEAEKKKKRIDDYDKKLAVSKQASVTFAEIDKMAKTKAPIFGSVTVELSPDDWKKVSELAKESMKTRNAVSGVKLKNKELTSQNELLTAELGELKRKLKGYEGGGITEKMALYQAMSRAPRRFNETVADIMRQPPEQQAHNRQREKSMTEVR